MTRPLVLQPRGKYKLPKVKKKKRKWWRPFVFTMLKFSTQDGVMKIRKNHSVSKANTGTSLQWLMQGGHTGAPPPPKGPDSFVLTFCKSGNVIIDCNIRSYWRCELWCQNYHMETTPMGLAPSTGNPGSATALHIGGPPAHTLPKGPDSFVLTNNFFETALYRELAPPMSSASPTGNPGYKWICLFWERFNGIIVCSSVFQEYTLKNSGYVLINYEHGSLFFQTCTFINVNFFHIYLDKEHS